MKLKSRLRGSPLESLQSIAEFWDLLPDEEETRADAAALADYLYPRVQTPAQFRRAFEKLEVSERDWVYFLALHGGELPVEEFKRRCGLHSRDKMQESIQRLNRRGFAWREIIRDDGHRRTIIGVPEPFVRLIDLPPYWKGFLGHYLQNLGLTELKAIARLGLGQRYEGRRKQVLVHFLRDRLLDPIELKRNLDEQNADARGLFQQILRKNGACVLRDLLDGGVQKKFNHQRAETLQNLIKHSGLIYVSRTAPNHYNNMLMVPRDLSHIIQSGFRGDERTLGELSHNRIDRGRQSGSPEEPRPSVILDNTQNILRDLGIVLGYILHHHVKVLNNGGIGRNDIKKVAPQLSHNKTIPYVTFLGLFGMSKKLIIPVGDRWRVSKHALEWFADSRRCYREMYEFWLGTTEWNEEYVDGDVVHVDHYPKNLIDITELRRLVLRVLEKVPVETWIDFETFAESLLPQVAIEIPGRFDRAAGERFNRHMLLILESIIGESLYWFGLVTLGVTDLAVARELGNRVSESGFAFDLSHPVSLNLLTGENFRFRFKVGATGRRMFGGKYLHPEGLFSDGERENLPYSGDSRVITVQPNLDIITPPDLNLSLFFQLLHFAEAKKVDIMTTLALTPESLRMGMELGMSGEEILRILKDSSRKELPETIQQLVEECAGRHGEVDVGLAGGYIVANNRLHVEELRANGRIQRAIKDVFGERVILLNRTVDLSKITRELQKMGYMPRVASETLHVTGEGLFHITLQPEELYDLLAILSFAQGMGDEGEGEVFDGRARVLLERLGQDVKGDFNPDYYTKPLIKAFEKNYKKLVAHKRDDENRRLKKQVNRLLNRSPRRREPMRFKGENPTSDPGGITKMMKFAIEHDNQVKIHYERSTGEKIDEVIEPESLQGARVYALCPEDDEHHIYAIARILRAAI